MPKGLPKRLTDQQMKFAHELVTNEGRITATQAAVNAGYAKESARSRASELQNPKVYPLVVKYMGELRAEWQKKYEVTYDRHISELGKIRQAALAKGAWSAAVNAEVARGKAAGLYIEQKIIRTGKLEDLSSEELENRMKEILDEYSPILEGVEVTDLTNKVKERQQKMRLQPNKDKPVTLDETSDYLSESSSSSSSDSESSS
jgi:phage terminase small subunit|tara:strand:+ start:1184 stop:1792 length:609 start_codon:yes stop_codon:yes gene_type:complete